MSSIHLSLTQKTRTLMARSLASFLKDRGGVTIKHTLANAALAHVLGGNEHSLAAKLAAGPVDLEITHDGAGPSKRPGCSVSGCTKSADVAVHLFDLYPNGELFDEQDTSCPFLCTSHMLENERGARGERRPRGSVEYPFTNQEGAQGFTIYREIHLARPDDSEPDVPEAEEQQMTAFDGSPLEDHVRDLPIHPDARSGNTFTIRIGTLQQPVTIRLVQDGGIVRFTTSHAIHTPVQAGPYRTSRRFNDTPESALRQAVTGLTRYYEEATRLGHAPDEAWLVPY